MFCQNKKNHNDLINEQNSEKKEDFEIKKKIFTTIFTDSFQSTTKATIDYFSFKDFKLNSTKINESLLTENLSNQESLSDLILSSELRSLNVTCNSENCQFGKCILNGTCDCRKPAFGKYCDQIDECLVLMCKNVI